MSDHHTAVARKQLDRRLSPLRNMALAVPPKGWIRAIRDALGMTTRQLAARMGVAPSRIPALEKAELSGSTTLRTLRQAAEAMNCTVVYVLVPTESLDDIVLAQAMKKSSQDVARLDHTMRLENQALLKADLDAERQRMTDRLLAGSLRGLWDEDPNHGN